MSALRTIVTILVAAVALAAATVAGQALAEIHHRTAVEDARAGGSPSAAPTGVVATPTVASPSGVALSPVDANLRATKPPLSSGPAAQQRWVAFANDDVGYMATGRGQPVPGRIQRTRDGGVTWADVWRGADRQVSWVGIAKDGTVVAAGFRDPRPTEPHEREPLVLRSVDGGDHWTEIQADLPAEARPQWWALQFAFADHDHGFAVRDPHQQGPALRGILRTVDGGAHWSLTSFDAHVFPAGGLSVLDARTVYVTTAASDGSYLLLSRDGGVTWRGAKLPRDGVIAVQFLTTEIGFVGGGSYRKWDEKGPWQFVLGTRDGGRSWAMLYSGSTAPDAPTNPITRFAFVDAAHGWALTGGCAAMGASGPCGGGVLVTSDGGRTWRDTHQYATSLSVVGSGAWATGSWWYGVLWRTTDWGVTWGPLARPESAAPSRIWALERRLVAQTAAGYVESIDGGKSWSRSLPSVLRTRPRWWSEPTFFGASGLAYIVVDPTSIEVATDGATVQRIAIPQLRERIVSMAALDERHLLAAGESPTSHQIVDQVRDEKGNVIKTVFGYQPTRLFLIADGGATWREIQLGDFLGFAPDLALGDRLAAALGYTRLVFAEAPFTNWHAVDLPKGRSCEHVSVAGASLWLSCVGSSDIGGSSLSLVIVSPDAGKTWRVFKAPSLSRVSAVSEREAWARSDEAVWHTMDGGANWDEIWIGLPGTPLAP